MRPAAFRILLAVVAFATSTASGPARAAFPPLLEITGRVVEADGERPLDRFLPPSFLYDLATDEASFVIETRASSSPDSTAAVAITLETSFSTEGSSAACGGAPVRLALEVEFDVLEQTDVVDRKGASPPEVYQEIDARFTYDTRSGGSSDGCLATGGPRDATWGVASIEVQSDDVGQVTDASSGFPPEQVLPDFVSVPTGDAALMRRYPRDLDLDGDRGVATFRHEYVHPGGDESEGFARVHLEVGQAIGLQTQGVNVREVTESFVRVRVTVRKFVDAAGPVSSEVTSFSSLKGRFGR